MAWQVTSAVEEDAWFQEYVTDVLSLPVLSLPPRRQRIGRATARWHEVEPGTALIKCVGGSIEDRVLAENVMREQLAQCGIRQTGFSVTASWTDVMAKAKRLVQSGNVSVLRNGYQYVVGHIVGDHGEYNTELMRQSPDSRVVTQWSCECPWDQFAFQRTRQFKKFEGRMCSHALALTWKAQATPLDAEEGGPQGPLPGQRGPNVSPGQMSLPGMTPGGGAGGTFNPDGSMSLGDMGAQGPDLGGASTPGVPGAQGPSQGVIPPFPGAEPLPLPQPGQTPSGMPSQPNAVSVPGAKVPSPFNPVQYPGGTYSKDWETAMSKTAATFQPLDIVRLKRDEYGQAEGKGASDYRPVPAGSEGEVLGEDETTGYVEVIFPLNDSGPMQPFHVRMFIDSASLAPTGKTSPGPFVKRR